MTPIPRLRTMLMVAILMIASTGANAALVLVTSRVALAGDDFIDWGNAGAEFSDPTNPFNINSNNGIVTTVSQAGNSAFERRNQSSGWSGNFANGDELLWTQGGNGPMSLAFNQTIQGGGAQIMRNQFGAFVATIEAFDSGNNSLGSFNVNGNGTTNNDNSAIFVGVLSTSADIARISFSVSSTQDFAINQFDIVTGVALPNNVPLPAAAFAAPVLAGLGVGFARKFRRR